MTRTKREDTPAPDFEKSLQELEQLVARLERGDLPLAESLALCGTLSDTAQTGVYPSAGSLSLFGAAGFYPERQRG